MSEPRFLLLLNPGRQSRFYLLGLARAASRLGIPAFALELKPLWDQVQQANDKLAATQAVGRELAKLCERERLTHVLGYGYNGVELGRVFGPGVEPLFASLGLQHLMLWTDHPNWMMNGIAMGAQMAGLLAHPRHVHFLKSDIAAAEAKGVLGWPNVFGLAMAEDYELVRPAADVLPTHDVVGIIGSAGAVCAEAARFLDDGDPDAGAIDAALAPAALSEMDAAMKGLAGWADARDQALAWGERVLAAKRERPLDGLWRIATEGGVVPPPWLVADARRWYPAAAALRTSVQWRRDFWLAWLARRRTVLLCGCDARAITPDQPEWARAWVDYEQQSRVYALGGCAINTNAAHDEEGCTHKPFQIAASGVACVHHASRGLAELFHEPEEIMSFAGGTALLEAVDTARLRRGDFARAIRERAVRDHTWDGRLLNMLELAKAASQAQDAKAGPA
ncbi:MAG: glycosyltransferase [Phycisphaerales bacterium]|jgi:hypothetical protein